MNEVPVLCQYLLNAIHKIKCIQTMLTDYYCKYYVFKMDTELNHGKIY